MCMTRRVAWRSGVTGCALVLALVEAAVGAPIAAGRQDASPAQAALYRCVDAVRVEAAALGFSLCDAEPTPLLARRAEPDNLQIRDGALVAAVNDGGVAALAGVQAGDLIYRVAGADVTRAADAGRRLANVGSDSDTQINFLRRGRPYRIKLRR